MTEEITYQHTYTFSETGESVTLYISDTSKAFTWGISFSHKPDDTIKWTHHYAGILQMQSKVNPKVWYIVLSEYWNGGEGTTIPVERVMMVRDCNA